MIPSAKTRWMLVLSPTDVQQWIWLSFSPNINSRQVLKSSAARTHSRLTLVFPKIKWINPQHLKPVAVAQYWPGNRATMNERIPRCSKRSQKLGNVLTSLQGSRRNSCRHSTRAFYSRLTSCEHALLRGLISAFNYKSYTAVKTACNPRFVFPPTTLKRSVLMLQTPAVFPIHNLATAYPSSFREAEAPSLGEPLFTIFNELVGRHILEQLFKFIKKNVFQSVW